MKRSLSLLFIVCLGCAARPTKPPALGPQAPNEKVLAFEGSLEVKALPQHAVEVRSGTVHLWSYLEAPCTQGREKAYGEAEAQAKVELAKFSSVVVQQLDLQLQSVGQSGPSSVQAQAYAERMYRDVVSRMGTAERAYQKVEREGAIIERVFVRYSVPRKVFDDSLAQSLGERLLRDDVVRRTLESFDPDTAP
jgi:hypothetical protein